MTKSAVANLTRVLSIRLNPPRSNLVITAFKPGGVYIGKKRLSMKSQPE